MQFDRGFISPYMATNPEKMSCELDEPYILITDKKINNMKEIVQILEKVAQEGRSLLIIADDLDGEALAALILNLIRGTIKACAVKAPGFGDDQKEMLEDVAILTGAKVVTESQVNLADTDYKKTDLKKRLAKLGGSVAVVKVGAATETEMKEKETRIDDALNATKAATEEGVVTGGGVTLFRAIDILKDVKLDGDQQVGVNIVRRALEEPLRQIAKNAGRESAEVVSKLRTADEHMGYNAKKDVYEDLVKAGVIDPTKVVRNALQNAASIAALFLTTEAIVTTFDDEKDEKGQMVII